MALYGGARDISMFRKVNRELMGNIISEEVIYYKYNITTTKNLIGYKIINRYNKIKLRDLIDQDGIQRKEGNYIL